MPPMDFESVLRASGRARYCHLKPSIPLSRLSFGTYVFRHVTRVLCLVEPRTRTKGGQSRHFRRPGNMRNVASPCPLLTHWYTPRGAPRGTRSAPRFIVPGLVPRVRRPGQQPQLEAQSGVTFTRSSSNLNVPSGRITTRAVPRTRACPPLTRSTVPWTVT